MRNKFVSLQALALLVIFCLTGSLTRAAVNPKPFVVPELKQWTGKDGNFTPGKDTRIVCTSQNPELLRIARMFADDYQQMFGQTLSVAQGKATSGDFVLSLSADKKLGEEGYRPCSHLRSHPDRSLLEHTHTPATGGTKSGTLTPARNDS
jgi:hexosaminidase